MDFPLFFFQKANLRNSHFKVSFISIFSLILIFFLISRKKMWIIKLKKCAWDMAIATQSFIVNCEEYLHLGGYLCIYLIISGMAAVGALFIVIFS